jgi:signal transduction histidine kinase
LERQKDEFLASVSHDLRTPLTAIKASIGVVLANEPPGTPEPLHRMFVNIERAADRMAHLVVDLLELTRLQAGRVELRPVCCDLCELARRSAHAIEPLASARGQQLRLDLPPEPLYARVDPDRLERALLNVLDNAHKYGTVGGTIGLRLELRKEEVLLAVSDDGPGIPEAEQQRIFERFYRSETDAARRNHGSGLGLPIARAMVELHGGRI